VQSSDPSSRYYNRTKSIAHLTSPRKQTLLPGLPSRNQRTLGSANSIRTKYLQELTPLSRPISTSIDENERVHMETGGAEVSNYRTWKLWNPTATEEEYLHLAFLFIRLCFCFVLLLVLKRTLRPMQFLRPLTQVNLTHGCLKRVNCAERNEAVHKTGNGSAPLLHSYRYLRFLFPSSIRTISMFLKLGRRT